MADQHPLLDMSMTPVSSPSPSPSPLASHPIASPSPLYPSSLDHPPPTSPYIPDRSIALHAAPPPENTTSSSHQGGHGHRRTSYYHYASIYINVIFLSVILLLTLLHVYSRLHHRHARKHHPGKRKWMGGARRWCSAQGTRARNGLALRSFPGWLYGPETVLDGVVTLGYCTILGIYCFCKANPFESYLLFANTLGVMSFSQLPLILLLIMKNNPISSLTGITYQKLNYLHRASSRACLLLSWLHALLWTPEVWYAGHFSHAYIIWGLIAIFGFTLLWITSWRLIRRVAYEFFLVAHIVGTLLYLVGAIFHWRRLAFWVWPSLGIWLLDRFIRFCKNTRLNKMWRRKDGECKIELLHGDVMRITAKRKGMKWSAGQHAFLASPRISAGPHEAHPFTIASIPRPGQTEHDAVFLVRIHSGFTKRLAAALDAEVTHNVPIYLEGAYGAVHGLESYDTVVLIAGGTGITFVLAHLLSLCTPPSPFSLPSRTKHIHLIWHIRNPSDLAWITPLLNTAISDLLRSGRGSEVKLEIDVHVTKSSASDEPAPLEGFAQTVVEHMAPGLLAQLDPKEADDEVVRVDSAETSDEEEAGSDASSGEEEEEEIATPSSSEGLMLPPAHDEDNGDVRNALLPGGGGLGGNKLRRGSRALSRLGGFGLSRLAEGFVMWRRGRADLRECIEGDARGLTAKVGEQGRMIVVVCGPQQLLHTTRRAVRETCTPRWIREGGAAIDYFEETLGA